MSAHLQTISRFFFGIVDQPQERDYRSVEQESKKSKLRLVFSQLIIQMAEQNKEKERCSGSYRQAVGFLVIKIGTYEILFFLNLYSISHNSKVLSENKKRIPEINGVTRRLVTN
jgi:hypothetical protein